MPIDIASPEDALPSPKYSWNETLKTLLWAALLAIVFRSFLFEPFHIPSGSMKSNLLVGDYLFVSKYSYGYSRYSFPLGIPFFEGRKLNDSRPKRGDVVVFRLPRNPRVDFIKRVMGLPGDKIQVKGGIVHINGVACPEVPVDIFTDDEHPNDIRNIPRLHETLPEGKIITVLQERGDDPADNTPVYTVPEKHYFMMGDNRDNSRDSRYMSEVGFIPEENIVGRAEIIFFSIDSSGSLTKPWTWPKALRYDRFFTFIH